MAFPVFFGSGSPYLELLLICGQIQCHMQGQLQGQIEIQGHKFKFRVKFKVKFINQINFFLASSFHIFL